MRKIIAGLFVSVDGVVESPEEWHFPYWSDEMQEAVGSQFDEADILLLGRATYEVFAATWPHRGGESLFADQLNGMRKLVASTTLKDVEWQNSALIEGDVAEALTRLKAEPGKNITISGSPTLVRSLLRENVLDELRLLVHPIVLGSGRRLFEDKDDHRPLRLVDSVTFGTGVLNLTYAPA